MNYKTFFLAYLLITPCIINTMNSDQPNNSAKVGSWGKWHEDIERPTTLPTTPIEGAAVVGIVAQVDSFHPDKFAITTFFRYKHDKTIIIDSAHKGKEKTPVCTSKTREGVHIPGPVGTEISQNLKLFDKPAEYNMAIVFFDENGEPIETEGSLIKYYRHTQEDGLLGYTSENGSPLTLLHITSQRLTTNARVTPKSYSLYGPKLAVIGNINTYNYIVNPRAMKLVCSAVAAAADRTDSIN